MSKLYLTKEQEQTIIDYYLVPHSLKETSSFFNISRTAVSTILKHNNISKHSQKTILELTKLNTERGLATHLGDNYKEKLYAIKTQDKIKFSQEQINQILNYYNTPQSVRNTAKHFNVSTSAITRILLKNNIQLHSDELNKKLLKQNCTSDEAIAKSKKTCLEKYGTEYSFQSTNNKEKSKKTCLEKYGETNYTKTAEYNEKKKQTCLKKYGKKSFSQTLGFKLKLGYQLDNILQQSRKTCLEKYGVENFTQTEEFKKFMHSFMKIHAADIQEKSKKTCLEKYNAEYYFNSDEYKYKLAGIKKALTARHNEIQAKSNETKRKNGTFNTSNPEEKYYLYLINKYGQENIIRQYKDGRCPYLCDFYIKSTDTFIELNLHWSHGGKVFEGTEADIQKLNNWKEKAKTSQFYKNAIETWTMRDVEKLSCFIKNNLNYKIYYSEAKLYN